MLLATTSCKTGSKPGAFAGWSCDLIKDESRCDEWASLSDEDVTLKRDNVCHLGDRNGEFAQKPCPREKLVGICDSPGAEETGYYYATGAKPYTNASAKAELCDKLKDVDPRATWTPLP